MADTRNSGENYLRSQVSGESYFTDEGRYRDHGVLPMRYDL